MISTLFSATRLLAVRRIQAFPLVVTTRYSIATSKKQEPKKRLKVSENPAKEPKRKRAAINGYYITTKEERILKLHPDPKGPHRPPNPYALFIKDFFEKHKAKDGENVKMTDVSKSAADKWNKMTDKQKEPFKAKYEKVSAHNEKVKEKYTEEDKEAWLNILNTHFEKKTTKLSICCLC